MTNATREKDTLTKNITNKEDNNKYNNNDNDYDIIYHQQYKSINGFTTYMYRYIHPLEEATRRNEWEYNKIELNNI